MDRDNKSWIEQQDIELIKNLKSVESITYPDGKKGYLNQNIFII